MPWKGKGIQWDVPPTTHTQIFLINLNTKILISDRQKKLNRIMLHCTYQFPLRIVSRHCYVGWMAWSKFQQRLGIFFCWKGVCKEEEEGQRQRWGWCWSESDWAARGHLSLDSPQVGGCLVFSFCSSLTCAMHFGISYRLQHVPFSLSGQQPCIRMKSFWLAESELVDLCILNTSPRDTRPKLKSRLVDGSTFLPCTTITFKTLWTKLNAASDGVLSV